MSKGPLSDEAVRESSEQLEVVTHSHNIYISFSTKQKIQCLDVLSTVAHSQNLHKEEIELSYLRNTCPGSDLRHRNL